jgi:uncharacterized membrane protein
MSELPIHPMVVHFPIVLATLLPIACVAAIIAIRRKARPRLAWAFPVIIVTLLLGGGMLATRTGEFEEERVHNFIADEVVEQHEVAAARFLLLTAAVFALSLIGWLRGRAGSTARVIATVGSVVVAVMVYQVGKAGGELVYKHNAAAAYADNPGHTP